MRRPGIEPGPRAWKARILTIELSTLNWLMCCWYITIAPTAGIEPATTWLRVMRSTIWAKRAETSLTGFEPAIFPLGEGCVIHCATEIHVWLKQCMYAATRDRTGDLQIFSLTLSQLSYSGSLSYAQQLKLLLIDIAYGNRTRVCRVRASYPDQLD